MRKMPCLLALVVLTLALSGCGLYRGEDGLPVISNHDQISLDGPVLGEPTVTPE